MGKEIPEEVYNSIETLAKYCYNHSTCKNCPFAYKTKDEPHLFFCKLYSEFKPSVWTNFIMKTEKEIIYEVI